MMNRKRAFWIATLASLFILLPNLIQPFNFNNNLEQTMGWQLVHSGRLPYLGTWDHDFPGPFFYHAAIISLVGTSPIGFRIFDILMQLSVSLLLFYFASRFLPSRFAILAAIFSALIYTAGASTLSGERDGFAVFLTLLSTTILYRYFNLKNGISKDNAAAILVLISGMVMGCTIAFRPTYALFPLIAAAVLFHERNTFGKRSWRFFLLGSLVPMGAIITFYSFQHNGILEFYLDTIQFNLDIYGTVKNRTPFIHVISSKTELLPDFILLFWSIMVFWDHKDKFGQSMGYNLTFMDKCFAIGYYLACRFSVFIMGKFYSYHYSMVYAISAILAADVLARLSGRLPRVGKIIPYATGVLVLLVLYKTTYVPHVISAILNGDTSPIKTAYLAPARTNDDYLLTDKLVDYLQRRNPQKESIECIGYFPSAYWRTSTEPATRFSSMSSWALELPHGGYTKYQMEWRKEFIDSLMSVRPLFIIVSQVPTFTDMLPRMPSYYLYHLPGFDNLLAKNYSLDTTILTWDIFKRRS